MNTSATKVGNRARRIREVRHGLATPPATAKDNALERLSVRREAA
jgi:hypothetical protein